MKKIFLGLLFLLVEIKLGRLGITPAWVGYLLILSGTGEVPESETFQRMRKLTATAAVFSGVIWLIELLGGPVGARWVDLHPLVLIDAALMGGSVGARVMDLLLTTVGVVFELLVMYRLTDGIEEIETACARGMRSDKLGAGWQGIVWGYIAFVVLVAYPPLSMAGLLAAFGAKIYYAVKFYQTARIYGEAVPS